jgi:hypothetical protein
LFRKEREKLWDALPPLPADTPPREELRKVFVTVPLVQEEPQFEVSSPDSKVCTSVAAPQGANSRANAARMGCKGVFMIGYQVGG